MIKLIKFLLLLGFAVLGAGFASINPEPVTVHYYFGDLTLPMGMLVLGVMAVGMVIGLFVSMFMVVKTRRENRSLKKKAELVNKEVNNLRTIPVKEP